MQSYFLLEEVCLQNWMHMTYVWTQAFLPRHWIKMQMTHSYNGFEKWLVQNHFQFSFSNFAQVRFIITLSQKNVFYFLFEGMVIVTHFKVHINKNQPIFEVHMYENFAKNSPFQKQFIFIRVFSRIFLV